MPAQIIESRGKKEYAVIPYKEYLKMQEEIEDYALLKILRKAKAEPDYHMRRPFEDVAKELGLTKGGNETSRSRSGKRIVTGSR
jgi:hypothetical protein